MEPCPSDFSYGTISLRISAEREVLNTVDTITATAAYCIINMSLHSPEETETLFWEAADDATKESFAQA